MNAIDRLRGLTADEAQTLARSARSFSGRTIDPCSDGVTPPEPTGSLAEQAGITRLIFPPRMQRLNVSTDFNVNFYAGVLPAGEGQSIMPDELQFQLNSGNVGWLQSFGIYVLAPDTGTSITWTLLMDGRPVPGYDNIQNFPGVVRLQVIEADDMQLRVTNNARLAVRITNNNDNGPWTVGAFYAGWTNPLAAEQRVWNLQV